MTMTVQSIPIDTIETLLATARHRLAAFQAGVVSDRPYYEGRVAALYDLLACRGDASVAAEMLEGAEGALQLARRRRLSEHTTGYFGGRIHAVHDALRRGGVHPPGARRGYPIAYAVYHHSDGRPQTYVAHGLWGRAQEGEVIAVVVDSGAGQTTETIRAGLTVHQLHPDLSPEEAIGNLVAHLADLCEEV